MCRSSAEGGRRCPGNKNNSTEAPESQPRHRVINNPTGPVNTGTGDQYNAPGTPGEPINVGTGRQYSGDEDRAASSTTRDADKARRKAERRARKAARRARRGDDEPTISTTIIGGTGPINVGSEAQFNRQRPDGTWETYTPGGER